MISRETFVALMKAIRKQDELDHKFSSSLNRYMVPDSYGPVYATRMIPEVLKALKEELKDKYDNISYFMYEVEWGKRADEFNILITVSDHPHYKKGERIKFYAAEDVYDYLKSDMDF